MNAHRYLLGLVATLLIVNASAVYASDPDVNDPRWGCYDALPSHPTPTEKEAYIAQLAPAAQAAERDGGPPAAGLLAMSALESGYGWTRTALFANNLFGWKYVSAASADGLGDWVLQCQPASDPNNRYVRFRDRGDSIGFVGARLKTNPRYAGITRRYHQDREGGMGVQDAVARWVKGIASAGYNPFADYPGKVLSIANDYLHPAAAVSADRSLYGYSDRPAAAATAAVDPPAPASAAQTAAADYLHAKLRQSRYMSVHCDDQPVTDWPGYEGRQVRRCQYSVSSAGKTLSGLVYLLDPSEANIAARIGGACAAVGLADRAGCGKRLAAYVIGQNSGHFPVAGFVIERKQDAGGPAGNADPVYMEFRDGNTIQSGDRLNFTDRQLSIETMEHAARAPVAQTRIYARIANADRVDYRNAGGTEQVGSGPAQDPRHTWLEVIRKNELQAQDTGKDQLLEGVAMRLKDELGRAR